jgi:hypothetical protein
MIADSLHSLQEVQMSAKQICTLNGTYHNSQNQIFTIRNYSENHEFEFYFKYGVNDEWECMRESEGTAKRMNNIQDEPGVITYYVGELEYPYLTFTFKNGGVLHLWADSQWLGMDCSKFGDSQEEKYTKFTKR